MTYGFVLDVPAPIEVYDTLHAEIVRRKDPTSCGMLVHVGRPTPEGFQVIEIWESKEQQERFNAEVVEPAMTQLLGRPAPVGGVGAGGIRAAQRDRPWHAGRRFTGW
jgi:hypothetical protein